MHLQRLRGLERVAGERVEVRATVLRDQLVERPPVDLLHDQQRDLPVLDEMDIGAEKGRGFTRMELPIWSEAIPIRVHGMLLARDRL